MTDYYRRSMGSLSHTLSMIQAPLSNVRFVIFDCPTEATVGLYLEELKHFNVSHIVRCCQVTYDDSQCAKHGIRHSDLPFKDGGVPSPALIREWLALIHDSQQREPLCTIAVHCVAGLGRAPVLVAIALIEQGMEPLDAIEFVRKHRRGAFNKPQIAFLDAYKRSPRTSSFKLSDFVLNFTKMGIFQKNTAVST